MIIPPFVSLEGLVAEIPGNLQYLPFIIQFMKLRSCGDGILPGKGFDEPAEGEIGHLRCFGLVMSGD